MLGCILAAAIFNWHALYTQFFIRDAGEREASRIVYKIRDSVILPEGIPALATIKDKSKINRGGVLAEGENGDKILLYYSKGKAVLYRPNSNKVVAIGPLVLDASAIQVKGTRIAIRNGNDDPKKVTTILDLLKSRYSEAKIASPEKASRSDFPSTIVIDLTAKAEKAEFVGAISELVGGEKGILPIGEAKPDADILIIIGKD